MEGARAALSERRICEIRRAGVAGIGRRDHIASQRGNAGAGRSGKAMKRIAVIGAGNMGSALIGGILKGGVADREHLAATVRTAEHAEELAAKYGICVTAGGNREAAAGADLVVLAVKPGT